MTGAVPIKRADRTWIKDCQVCNAGLVARMDDLLNQGETIKGASRILAKEARKHGVQIITAGGIRGRYRYHKQGKNNWEKAKSVDDFERDFKHFLAHLRTATNNVKRINAKLPYKDLDRVKPLMERVDVKACVKELTRFIMLWEGRELKN